MWQEEQRLSRFDDGAVRMRRQNERDVHSNIAEARAQDVVRSRVDAYYDPSHPDADWSGLVENRGTKKYVPQASHIERTTEGGIVAKPAFFAERGAGKRHVQDDGRFTTEPQRTKTEVVDYDSPYVTAAQLAQRGAATDHEFRGTSTQRRGKKHVHPTFNRAPHAHPLEGHYSEPAPALRESRPNMLMGATANSDKPPARPGSLAGYRSKHFAPGSRSMMASITGGLARALPPPERAARANTDNWTSHNKEILARGGVLPGYTGTTRR